MTARIDTVIGIPVDSIGKPGGTELAPAALRETGLIAQLGAQDLGDLPVRIRGTERDPTTGIVAYESVVEAIGGVRTGLVPVLREDRRPLVLGGCCSVVPGILAALADAINGRIGVAYIDGHLDLYDGHSSPTGEAADMPLAQSLGHGDPRIVGCGPRIPLVDPDGLALLGFRDLAEAATHGSLLPTGLGGDPFVKDAPTLLGDGPAATGTDAATRLHTRCAAYHLQIDVDVLSTDAFPATPIEYYQPGGLSVDELIALARPLASDPACHSVGIACYDPELDSESRVWADRLSQSLHAILSDD